MQADFDNLSSEHKLVQDKFSNLSSLVDKFKSAQPPQQAQPVHTPISSDFAVLNGAMPNGGTQHPSYSDVLKSKLAQHVPPPKPTDTKAS